LAETPAPFFLPADGWGDSRGDNVSGRAEGKRPDPRQV